jgi:hypothetical protein
MPKRLLLGCNLKANDLAGAAREWDVMAAECAALLNAPPASVLAGCWAATLLAPAVSGSVRLKVDHNLEDNAVLLDVWQEAVPLD